MEKTFQSLNGVIALGNYGLIRVQGDDAAKFLHGQLTNDFVLLGTDQARLAGYCSAKGRLLASFIGFKRSPTDILLVCSRDILAATQKRLSMFVMRAKARISDASADFALFGLVGAACQNAMTNRVASADGAWAKADFDDVSLVTLYPADDVVRALWLAPVDHAAPAGEAITQALWDWSEVRSGIATVSAPIVEAFVPQMLNYESVGGVNFKKGCYPGQEVVARSQFRGTLKRRAYLAHGDTPMTPGDEVFAGGPAGQPCGTVAHAAASPAGGFDAIVSMQISAFEAGGVSLGGVDGPPLALSAPPYPLLADI
ncbi:MAG: folate-binding protein YgfZ [Comamonadaceae bacterium]|nr:folate-binding protein YgfZ [Comamonadaceae bacterium]